MKIINILTEKVSSVLYHIAPFGDALKILSQNTMKAWAKPNAEHEISFTRSLTGSYHSGNKIIGVIFEFDGDKLNQKYKGKPVGTEDHHSINNDDVTYRGKDNKQLEDRVYAKGGISNITDYIKSAIMFAPAEFISNNDVDEFDTPYTLGLEDIPDILNLLSEYNIPVRFVIKVKDLYNRNSNNKDGFFKTLEKISGGHYEKNKSKSYTIHITRGETLPDGEIDEYSGSNVQYHNFKKNVNARNAKEAEQIGKKLVAQFNSAVPKKNRGKLEFFFDEAEENDDDY